MVRGGWYHFLVLNDDKSVSVLIGKIGQHKFNGAPTFSNCSSTGTENACVTDTLPVEAPAGHPLAVPSTVKSTAEGSTGKDVKDIACGAYHCIVRHTDDSITCWGLNGMGQCNTPATLANGTHAKAKKVVGLHAGYSTTAVTFNDGTVLCWGDPEVADAVNTWTDIMMSPPNNLASVGGRDSIDNYDSANTGYAKPRYAAAYNNDPNLVTWNAQSDPNGYYHNFAEDRHCSPMFDLGVEVNPTLPMEYDPILTDLGYNALPVASEYSFINSGLPTDYKYVGAQYPYTDNDPNYIPSEQLGVGCDVLCITNPNSALWQDFLGMKWRNSVFNAAALAAGFSNPTVIDGEPTSYAYEPRKSCCDLEIKKDYAVAIRRTGQMITTRNTRSAASCPSNTYCRDCDGDRIQQVSNGQMGSYNANCPPNVGDPCASYPNCACCSAASGGGYYLGCPDCSTQQCASDRIYSISADGYNSASQCSFFEGIGCMSSIPRYESAYHNPNWANATSGSLSSRWTAGLQVVYGRGLTRPTANTAFIQQNYGWTTVAATDGINNLRSTGGDFSCENFHIPSDTLTCAKLCKTSGSWEPSAMDPQGTPLWNYPEQMFTQAVQAGSNTVLWTQLGLAPTTTQMTGEGDGGVATCVGCGQLDKICRDSKFWYKTMPNTGELTTSCLFTGVNRTNSAENFTDKYNCENPHRFGTTAESHCVSSAGIATTINYNLAAKPWGPFAIAVWQGASRDNLNSYPNCHCCQPGTGQQIRPPGCAEVIGNEYSLNTNLDAILGTYYGMPYEANMHCYGPIGVTGNRYPWCTSRCEFLGDDPEANWSNYSTPFCANYPTKSAASTRMAFAIVRADHRAYEIDGVTPKTPPGKCGQYPDNNYAYDPSQWVSCTAGWVRDNSRDSEMMLHVWGSLWDPCPPWPRVCDCTAKIPIDPESECTSPYDNEEDYRLDITLAYASPCDSIGESYHAEGPAGSEAGTGTPVYPSWTRTPTTTSRSARKGHWETPSPGTYEWVQETPAANETTGAPTRYCPNCGTYPVQYRRDIGLS